MKRLITVALVAAAVAAPAWAQRGGSRGGGFSGRSGPGFHGGFAPSATPVYRAGGYGAAGRPGARPERRRVYGVGVRYGYAGAYAPGWVVPEYDGYPDYGIYDDDSGAEPVDSGDQGDEVQPEYDGPPPPGGPYQAYAEAPPAAAPGPAPAAAPPAPEDAVTLIFKDGRPAEKIHNYALTRTTLYVRDGHKQDIPVADLDLAATEKANSEAGVEFELPSAR